MPTLQPAQPQMQKIPGSISRGGRSQDKNIEHFTLQGDSGGICNTLGKDSMCDSKQKSSYKHGSDFGRLRSYGHLLITLHALV